MSKLKTETEKSQNSKPSEQNAGETRRRDHECTGTRQGAWESEQKRTSEEGHGDPLVWCPPETRHQNRNHWAITQTHFPSGGRTEAADESLKGHITLRKKCNHQHWRPNYLLHICHKTRLIQASRRKKASQLQQGKRTSLASHFPWQSPSLKSGSKVCKLQEERKGDPRMPRQSACYSRIKAAGRYSQKRKISGNTTLRRFSGGKLFDDKSYPTKR